MAVKYRFTILDIVHELVYNSPIREEVVKKWEQAPRWLLFPQGLPEPARSQSPFLHNLEEKTHENLR
jgi:hypothetical protein